MITCACLPGNFAFSPWRNYFVTVARSAIRWDRSWRRWSSSDGSSRHQAASIKQQQPQRLENKRVFRLVRSCRSNAVVAASHARGGSGGDIPVAAAAVFANWLWRPRWAAEGLGGGVVSRARFTSGRAPPPSRSVSVRVLPAPVRHDTSDMLFILTKI